MKVYIGWAPRMEYFIIRGGHQKWKFFKSEVVTENGSFYNQRWAPKKNFFFQRLSHLWALTLLLVSTFCLFKSLTLQCFLVLKIEFALHFGSDVANYVSFGSVADLDLSSSKFICRIRIQPLVCTENCHLKVKESLNYSLRMLVFTL